MHHSACETCFNLARVTPLPKRLSTANPKAPSLTRLYATRHTPRLEGLRALLVPHAPARHSAQRRRTRRATQVLIYRAVQLIEASRRLILGLGAHA